MDELLFVALLRNLRRELANINERILLLYFSQISLKLQLFLRELFELPLLFITDFNLSRQPWIGKRFFRSQSRSQFLSFPSNIHQRKSSYYDDYTFSFARKFARNRSQFSRFSEHPNGFFPFAFVFNLAFKPKLLEQIFNFIHLLFIIQLVRQHIPQ